MMKLKRLWLLLALCGASMQAHADHAELYLSDESAQGRFATGADLIGLRQADLAFEAFVNEEDDLLGAIGLDFSGRAAGVSDWTFTAGPKIYAATLDIADDNFIAAAGGVKVGYDISTARRPVQLTGQFYYAPKISTSGDAEDLTDFIARIEMQFVPQVLGFVGYRVLEADLDNGNEYELDDDIHLGVRLIF